MLKVVGASPEQTKFFSILLAVVLIVAFFAVFFYEMPSKSEDGMYAATVIWSPKIGFKPEFWGQNNDPEKVPREAARAYYKPDDSHKIGWASMEIETSEKYPDWVQAYSAGMLEGSLSWLLIHNHWKNTVAHFCDARPQPCAQVREYLRNVEAMAKDHAKSAEGEPFWHHVRLFYYQLDGLEEGWNVGVSRSRKKDYSIPHEDFLWLNTVNEIKDLNLDNYTDDISIHYPTLSFLKHQPDVNGSYLLAHQTGRSYSEMLRMHKKYTFHFHETGEEGSALVPVTSLVFTSYPGAIHSQDDYYQVYIDQDIRLTIAGAHFQHNKSLVVEDQESLKVPLGPRSLTACRLARSARDWTQLMDHVGGSNIGGSQWLVLESGAGRLSAYLLEQVHNFTKAADITDHLVDRGFWVSAGLPFFQETKEELGMYEMDKRLQRVVDALESSEGNITSVESLYQMLHGPEVVALGRADIIPYSEEASRPRHGGLIDLKIAEGSGEMVSVAGPPYNDDVAPFQWSRSILQDLPHHGQPDVWKYSLVNFTWVW